MPSAHVWIFLCTVIHTHQTCFPPRTHHTQTKREETKREERREREGQREKKERHYVMWISGTASVGLSLPLSFSFGLCCATMRALGLLCRGMPGNGSPSGTFAFAFADAVPVCQSHAPLSLFSLPLSLSLLSVCVSAAVWCVLRVTYSCPPTSASELRWP